MMVTLSAWLSQAPGQHLIFICYRNLTEASCVVNRRDTDLEPGTWSAGNTRRNDCTHITSSGKDESVCLILKTRRLQ
jgi:hypothetical protein